jgi:hypothetical protein
VLAESTGVILGACFVDATQLATDSFEKSVFSVKVKLSFYLLYCPQAGELRSQFVEFVNEFLLP